MDAMWRNAVLGVITGDALGCPVQFKTREEIAQNPVTGMRGYGTFNLPAGSWTDDSSMTIALLVSIRKMHGIDLDDVMKQFIRWLETGVYTPYCQSFDVGRTTLKAIRKYQKEKKPLKCGLLQYCLRADLLYDQSGSHRRRLAHVPSAERTGLRVCLV